MQLRIGSRLVFKYLILLMFLSPSAYGAEAFPAKPIRILVAAAPGGGNDTIARVIGARLAESTGQQVIIDNRPSGNGIIAGEMLVRAPADGHTMLVVATAFTAAPGLMKKLPYDTLKDFAPITRVGMVPAALIVHSSLPVRTAKDFLTLARSKPGEITFGSAGVGTGSHLGGELFNLLQGTKLLHVPYKGSSIVTTALLSGEVMVAFTNPLSSMPHVKSGRLRNLGMAHPERWPLMPEYPTLTEMGLPGYDMPLWNGFVTKEGTPPAIVARLHTEILAASKNPKAVETLATDGARPMPQSTEEFAAFLRMEVERWLKVTKAAGIQGAF